MAPTAAAATTVTITAENRPSAMLMASIEERRKERVVHQPNRETLHATAAREREPRSQEQQRRRTQRRLITTAPRKSDNLRQTERYRQ